MHFKTKNTLKTTTVTLPVKKLSIIQKERWVATYRRQAERIKTNDFDDTSYNCS
jgi:transcriptional regulator of met regulon